jgi:hypothetical protein
MSLADARSRQRRSVGDSDGVARGRQGTRVSGLASSVATTFEAGKTFIIPAGIVHNDTNTGRTVARMLATYVVEKDKPLNSQIVR